MTKNLFYVFSYFFFFQFIHNVTQLASKKKKWVQPEHCGFIVYVCEGKSSETMVNVCFYGNTERSL